MGQLYLVNNKIFVLAGASKWSNIIQEFEFEKEIILGREKGLRNRKGRWMMIDG